MRNHLTEFDTLTLNLPKPKGDLLRAQLALTHQAKNLYNSGLFLVRQVFTAYSYDSVRKVSTIKESLQPVQIQVIDFFNSHIEKVNEKRKIKFPDQCAKAIAENKPEPKLKLISLLAPEVSNLASVILDATTLDNVTRHWSNENGESVYRRLPGVMAQQVIKKLSENFSSFFMASLCFKASQTDMTGRPQMPNYLGKNERFNLEIPLANVHRTFPSLGNKSVPENYKETSYLAPDLLKAFSDYDVTSAIDLACKKRGWAEFRPQHLRIVPMRNSVKMEVVVRVKNAYPEHSFMAKLIQRHGITLSELKNDKARDEWLLDHLKLIEHSKLPKIAAMDLGVNNLVTVAYSTGHKAAVHDGGRFEATLTDLGVLIAKRISSITPDRAKELQGKKNALKEEKKRLDRKEHIELNTLLKEVYEDNEYRRLVEKKNRWISDYLHKTSRALIEHCQSRYIDVIVIGRNKGWKQESNMGKKQNKRFCQVAHATLITLIKYKAEAAGMAVVTTEESYTSKTSFVNGDILESFKEKEALRSNRIEVPSIRKTGNRSSKDRNRFFHKNRNDRWRFVHSDVNGAFNILRKVFKSFVYHIGLTLKYTILRLSPRLGVTGLQAFAKA